MFELVEVDWKTGEDLDWICTGTMRELSEWVAERLEEADGEGYNPNDFPYRIQPAK